MTATSTARIPAEYLTDAVTGLLAEYERTCRADLLPVLADALQDAGAARAAADEMVRVAVHALVVAPKLAREDAIIAEARANREVSRRYWATARRGYMARVGYVWAGTHDLRGTPPAGYVWMRPATSGKWARSRRDKEGRPLTTAEMAAILAARAEKAGTA